MEFDRLKEYIQFMEDNNLSELEVEEEGKRIRLKKNLPVQPMVVAQGPPAASESQRVDNENIIEITSPMVGTFYRAPSPGARPYVEVGETIKPGDVVCIIEAMKLMNEIKAEVAGKIARIPVENGEPVEFGQALFVVEPA
jgi:acetyl-CoA carboxylase biotin carboxyl carrier protein